MILFKHFSEYSKPEQTDVIFSRFVSLSLVNQRRLPAKIDQSLGFPLCYTKSICFPRRVEHLPGVRLAESQNLLSLYFSGFLILRANKDTSPGICD